MRVLVTGGAGYIGSHTVRLLRARGDSVVVLDTLEHGYRAAIGTTTLVVGSTHDQMLVKEVVSDHRIEAVIPLAADQAGGGAVLAPRQYLPDNSHREPCPVAA